MRGYRTKIVSFIVFTQLLYIYIAYAKSILHRECSYTYPVGWGFQYQNPGINLYSPLACNTKNMAACIPPSKANRHAAYRWSVLQWYYIQIMVKVTTTIILYISLTVLSPHRFLEITVPSNIYANIPFVFIEICQFLKLDFLLDRNYYIHHMIQR